MAFVERHIVHFQFIWNARVVRVGLREQQRIDFDGDVEMACGKTSSEVVVVAVG